MGAVDPALKLALEAQSKSFLSEIDKRFTSYDEKWESRVGALENAILLPPPDSGALKAEVESEVAAHLVGIESAVVERLDQFEAASATRLAALEFVAAAFESWRTVRPMRR